MKFWTYSPTLSLTFANESIKFMVVVRASTSARPANWHPPGGSDPHLSLKLVLSLKTHLKWQIVKLSTKLATKNHVQEFFYRKL